MLGDLQAWKARRGRQKEGARVAVKGSVPAVGVIVPHLVVRDSAEAVNFYERAFAARIVYRSKSPSGQGEHLHLKVWASLVQVSSEEPNQDQHVSNVLASPQTLGGTTCVFQIGVPDVDAAYDRAVESGATPTLPPTDMFWGDRYAWVRDPFGHMWALCTTREVLTSDQVAERMQGEFGTEPSTSG
jgi:PhnB protein